MCPRVPYLSDSYFLFAMAGLGQVTLRKTAPAILRKYIINNNEATRLFASCGSKQNESNTTAAGRRIDSVADSLASKGFLRPLKPYAPPDQVAGRVADICGSCKVPSQRSHVFASAEEKFKLLEACFQDFKHAVPNSQLFEITTIDEVIKFYETPVDTTVPLDAMKNMQLPENLHIQHEYLRFHPETDTMFGGKTAFPKSSTLVTGLKYRGKYRGHEAKRSWP